MITSAIATFKVKYPTLKHVELDDFHSSHQQHGLRRRDDQSSPNSGQGSPSVAAASNGFITWPHTSRSTCATSFPGAPHMTAQGNMIRRQPDGRSLQVTVHGHGSEKRSTRVGAVSTKANHGAKRASTLGGCLPMLAFCAAQCMFPEPSGTTSGAWFDGVWKTRHHDGRGNTFPGEDWTPLKPALRCWPTGVAPFRSGTWPNAVRRPIGARNDAHSADQLERDELFF